MKKTTILILAAVGFAIWFLFFRGTVAKAATAPTANTSSNPLEDALNGLKISGGSSGLGGGSGGGLGFGASIPIDLNSLFGGAVGSLSQAAQNFSAQSDLADFDSSAGSDSISLGSLDSTPAFDLSNDDDITSQDLFDQFESNQVLPVLNSDLNNYSGGTGANTFDSSDLFSGVVIAPPIAPDDLTLNGADSSLSDSFDGGSDTSDFGDGSDDSDFGGDDGGDDGED